MVLHLDRAIPYQSLFKQRYLTARKISPGGVPEAGASTAAAWLTGPALERHFGHLALGSTGVLAVTSAALRASQEE